MTQEEAIEAVKGGALVKLPEWIGYWFLHENNILAATKEGRIVDAWTDRYEDRNDFEITDGKYAGVDLTEIFKIAEMCHETNRQWCIINGDISQQNWAWAADWQRTSMIKGVIYTLQNPDAPMDGQHNAWMKDKLENGWVYGPVKDEVIKTHHCLVPYDELPDVQKKKDVFFRTITLNWIPKKPALDPHEFRVIADGVAYALPEFEVIEGVGIQKTDSCTVIPFVRGSKLGSEDVEKHEGILHEGLLSVMIHDLKFKNQLVPSRESSVIITKLEEALAWMGIRQNNRKKAGTQGTYKK